MRVIVLIMTLFMLIGMTVADNEEKEGQLEKDAAYDNPTTLEEKDLKFNFEQKVNGKGFFAAYKYAQMPNAIGNEGRLFNGVEAKNKAHGSGQLETDSVMYAESSYTNRTWIYGALDEDGEIIEDEEEATSVIQLKDDSKIVYSPLTMGIGTRYYDQHPVAFDVLLKEEDLLKNRDGLNSLHHFVDQAHGLNLMLDAQSESTCDETNNTMNIEEDLVDGRSHFGALHLASIPLGEGPKEDSEEVPVLGLAIKGWKKPLIEIDEDYVGSFHIEKNMNLHTYGEEEEEEDPWLPCCFGGFSDMNYLDAKAFKSARGIFDCTCSKVPTEAQFSR